MEIRRALETVVAITVTPFDDKGQLDPAAHTAVVARMAQAGVPVITANGNTGEFYALSASEMDEALRLTVEAAGPALVIAGVGYELERAVGMARSAAEAGATAIMVHQPVHPYQSAEGWIGYHRAIADAAPELGVVCYLRDPRVDGARLARLAELCPNFIGVKYAVPDVLAFARTQAAVPAGRLAWVCGLAELWAPYFWLAGARGFTSGLATVAPEMSLSLLDRLRSADFAGAMRLWEAVRPLEELRARDGSADNVSVIKEALAQRGLCGRGVRLPSTELSAVDREAVAEITGRWSTLL